MVRQAFILIFCGVVTYGQSFLGQGYLGLGGQMGSVGGSFHPMGVEFGGGAYYLVRNQYGLGLTGGFAGYAHRTEPQSYEFNGYTTQTNVNLSASLFSVGFSFLMFALPLQSRMEFNPYIIGQVLYVGNTASLNIEDPNDPYGCTPVESEVLHFNDTWSISFGAGNLFFPFKGNTNLGISVECAFQIGGNIDFVDVHQDWASSDEGMTSNAIEAEFRHVQSGTIHHHRVGTIYSSPLKYLHGRVGVWYYFH